MAYKRKYWPELENGHLAIRPQHDYPHILPVGNENKNDGIIEVWNRGMRDVPSLRHIVVEELMARVDQVGRVDVEWRGYLKERCEV